MVLSDDWVSLLQHRVDPRWPRLHLAVPVLHCGTARSSSLLRPMTAANGGHRGSYLLDGLERRDCGERRGRHLPHVHVHVAAVLAHGQRWIFFRHVLGLFDIFRGLFHLRLAVDNRVGHFIQVITIRLAENCGGAGGCRLFLEPSSFWTLAKKN